jgi:hypothetical protein
MWDMDTSFWVAASKLATVMDSNVISHLHGGGGEQYGALNTCGMRSADVRGLSPEGITLICPDSALDLAHWGHGETSLGLISLVTKKTLTCAIEKSVMWKASRSAWLSCWFSEGSSQTNKRMDLSRHGKDTMTRRTNPGIPFDDDDEDDDDEVQATPPQPFVHELQQGIRILRYGIAGVSQFESMAGSTMSSISGESHVRAFEQIRAAAGVAGDPMAQLLADSAVMCHIQAARLIVKASNQPPEVADIYHKASARYLSETRKQVLALREYRSPVVAKQVTVVQQQNVAHGDQTVACLTANVTPMASLPAAISDQCITVITEGCGPVAAITHEPRKSTDELIIESFMATPEVREHLAKMDAAMALQLEAQPLDWRSANIADAILAQIGTPHNSSGD